MKSFVFLAAMMAATASAQTPLWTLSTTRTRLASDGSVGYTEFGSTRKVDLFTERPLGVELSSAGFVRPADDGVLAISSIPMVQGTSQLLYFALVDGTTGVEKWRRLVYEGAQGSGISQPTPRLSHNGRYVMARRNYDLAGNPGSLSTTWYRVADGKLVGGVEGDLIALSDGLHGIANGRFYRLYTGEEVSPLFSYPANGVPYDARGGWVLGRGTSGKPIWAVRERDGLVRNIALSATEIATDLAVSARLPIFDGATKSIVLLNLETGARKTVVTDPAIVSSRVSPNGEGHVAMIGTRARLYPLLGGTPRTIFYRSLERADFDALGRPRVWMADSRSIRTEGGTEIPGTQETISLGTDPSNLRLSTNGELGVIAKSGKVYRRVVKTGVETLWYTPLAGYNSTFAADRKSAIEFKRDGATKEAILVWHGDKGETFSFRGPVNSKVQTIMPDGRVLLSERVSGLTWLKFYDPKTGIMRRSYNLGRPEMNTAPSTSADGKRLLFYTGTGSMLLDLNTATHRVVPALTSGAALSPDGKLYYDSDHNFDLSRILVRRVTDDAVVLDAPGRDARISSDGSRVLTWGLGSGLFSYYALPASP